jgi:hypothetical protein
VAARPHAAGGDGLHFGVPPSLADHGVDGVVDGLAAGRKTGRAGAAEDAAAKGLLPLLFALRHRFKIGSVHVISSGIIDLIGNSFMSRKVAKSQRFLLLASWRLCVRFLITDKD